MPHSNAPDIILLEGIEVPAALGVTEAERQMRRPVRLDLELGFDLRPSGQTDDLSQTIDYGEIYEIVEKVAGGREHKLVEALGERIANALFENFPVESVQLTVRKSKPIAGVLDWAGVRITRTR
ncbi:MAG TPA: dihydroneopterin aldolase [Myxococcales bacterium]|nr:dihydroneopterin aldolase [Myxococcales bacterium]HIM01756.1 dihydroneopterin aldolase [Myxococcales bacterium]